MPDRVMTNHAAGEPHQTTLANASSGSASAGSVVLVIPDGMTNAALRRGLRNLLAAAQRDPQRFSGI